MSKPGKVLKGLCKKLGVRLTVKRGKKRVYKSVKVLKAQCKRKQKKKKVKKKKKKVKRRRKFGSTMGTDGRVDVRISAEPPKTQTNEYLIIHNDHVKDFEPNSIINVDSNKIKHVHNLNVTETTVVEEQYGRGYVTMDYKQYKVTHNNETIKWTPTRGFTGWSTDYWFVTIH